MPARTLSKETEEFKATTTASDTNKVGGAKPGYFFDPDAESDDEDKTPTDESGASPRLSALAFTVHCIQPLTLFGMHLLRSFFTESDTPPGTKKRDAAFHFDLDEAGDQSPTKALDADSGSVADKNKAEDDPSGAMGLTQTLGKTLPQELKAAHVETAEDATAEATAVTVTAAEGGPQEEDSVTFDSLTEDKSGAPGSHRGVQPSGVDTDSPAGDPLPSLAKTPTSPTRVMALNAMLATHSDFQLDHSLAQAALEREMQAHAEKDAAEILFSAISPKSKKLPSVRGAYQAPVVVGAAVSEAAAADADDEFDAVIGSVVTAPPPPKVEHAGSTAVSLRARAAGKAPLRVAIVGSPRCGALTLATRLASEVVQAGSEEGQAGASALVDARTLEHGDAEVGSPALLQRVVEAIRDCPSACVLVHYPRSAGEAVQLKALLADEDLVFTSLIVLEGDRDEMLQRMQVMMDADGELVHDADFDEELALKEIEERKEACEAVAQAWEQGCTKVLADGGPEEVWERVALLMHTYLPVAAAAPPPPRADGDVEMRQEEEEALSPFTSPEKLAVGHGKAKAGAEAGGGGEVSENGKSQRKDQLKDRYAKSVEEEAKRKAEEAILAARPAAKKGKMSGMSAQVGDLAAAVEEGDEDAEEEAEGEDAAGEGEEGVGAPDDGEEEEEEPELVVGGDEDETGGAGAGAAQDKKAKSEKEKQEERDRIAFANAERAWAHVEAKELVDKTAEYAEQQQSMIVSAQSGERRATRIEKQDFVLGFEEVWDFFRGLNREATRGAIVTHTPPVGCFAILRAKLLGPPELKTEALKDERELVLCCGQLGFGQGDYASPLTPDIVHLKMLQTVRAFLTGDKVAKPRYGAHWEAIGFQGSDPATDLRDLGVFSVIQMVYLATKQLRKAKVIFRFASEHPEALGSAGNGFPFTLLCISLSKICLAVMRTGGLVGLMNTSGSVIAVLNTLHFGLLCDFYNKWRTNGWSVERGNFQQAIESSQARALKNPAAMIAAGQAPLWQPPATEDEGGAANFIDF